MKSFSIFVGAVFFSFTSIWAMDINTTLIDANSSVYKKLLHTLSKEKKQLSEVNLEKSLLKILIEPEKSNTKRCNITQVKDSKTYQILFRYYLDDAITLNLLYEQLEEDNSKIKTIENEIKSMNVSTHQELSIQLQDALYHKKKAIAQNKIVNYQKQMQQIKHLLVDGLESINLQNTNIIQNLKKQTFILKQLKDRISKYKINKERFALVSTSAPQITFINKKINELQNSYQNTLKNIIIIKFMQFSFALTQKDNNAFSIAKEIKTKLKLLGIDNINIDTSPLLESLETKYLGRLRTITGASKQEAKEVLFQGWSIINQPIFEINKTPISIFKLVVSLFIFIMGFIVGALYKHKVNTLSTQKKSLTSSTRTLLANVGYYIIITIAFFIALNILGVKLSSLALVAGALSVGIGFGLQNIVSNFVSGLILMFERSIKIGDYVQIDEQTRGYITDIRMRSTTIKTNENIDIIVPNQSFIENNVVNWTMKDTVRRFSIPFGVKYGTKPEQVIDIIEKAVLNSTLQDTLLSSRERKTRVIMTGMGDSSVNFELFIWVKGEKLRKPKRTASEFYVLIYNALYENDIEIPFPQIDLHIRSIEATLPLDIKR